MTLFLAALATLGAAALAGPLLARRPALALGAGSALAVLGCALGLAAVAPVLLGAAPSDLVLPWSEPLGAFHLRLDPLSAFFLAALFAVAGPASAFGATYMRPQVGRRPLGRFVLAYGLLLVSLSLVFAAADAVLFLVAWEVMTVTSFVLVTFEDERAATRRAGFVFLVASHVGTAFLVALFLLLSRGAGGFDFLRFESMRHARAIAPGLLLALGLVGFGTKAGIVPLHVWLPEAHPAAPSHVSAVLSGVMIKTGVYGMLRLLGFIPPPGMGAGVLLGVIGLGGALAAITLTLGQEDVKKALAYSSVENVGLVFLGIGLAVAAGAAGHPVVAALGMGGALFHVWNHALMKGLAFLGAGNLVHAAHSQDLERMGGLLARMPRTGALFLVAAASLAALPPLAGFASEWLLYLGLLRAGATAGSAASSLVAYLAVAVLALVGAIAAISFTRISGVALLGAPRSAEAARAHEAPAGGWAPLAVLAAGCVAFGLFPAWPLRVVAPVAAQLGMIEAPRVLGGAAEMAAAPRVVFLVLLAVMGGLYALRSRLGSSAAGGSADTWGCGFAAPTPRMEYTASSYAQLFLSSLVPRALRPRAHLQPPRGAFPGKGTFRTESQDPARTRLFDPLFRVAGDRMSRLRRFQAGRLNLQLLYTLLTLVGLLAALALRERLP
ncbi:MAG TPA: proton-conducting transporter membrane subunit [Anaeromyxobacteraceae bacterium]|nr:proton-conducting transporter membrane subunit [Anaeromyxobacteraceae bacterium]